MATDPSRTHQENQESHGVYFNADLMGNPSDNYICWLDVMGSKNHISQSLKTSANFIFKLHASILSAFAGLNNVEKDDIIIYPVMDGAFISGKSRSALEKLLRHCMRLLADTFLSEVNQEHKFVVRGAIAFGRVFHGRGIDDNANVIFRDYPEIKKSILLGLPMVLAFEAESTAPPFGIAIDRSARSSSPAGTEPYNFSWWKWFYGDRTFNVMDFRAGLEAHYIWHEGHHYFTGYSPDRIKVHKGMSIQYFET